MGEEGIEWRWWSGGKRGWGSRVTLWLPFNMGHVTHVDSHSLQYKVDYNTVNKFAKILNILLNGLT